MDVVGPDEAVGEWRLSDAAEEVLATIAERAALSEAEGIPRSQIDALARVGLLGSPLEPAPRQREVAERIAMADASVWFCWVQHQSPTRALASAEPADHAPLVNELKSRWLKGLQNGTFLGSVAVAHLRRPGVPNPVAERVHGGWSITGTLDWVTSWDISDVMLLMVRGAGEYSRSIICCYLAAGRDPAYLEGLHVREPLKLLAMSGTHTRPISFEEVKVPDTNVGSVLDYESWSQEDEKKTSGINPASFGVIRGALADLQMTGLRRGDEQTLAVAQSLGQRMVNLRRKAYSAVDCGAPAHECIALRAQSLDLAIQATTAVVIAQAGAAMRTGCSAERRVREAMFLQVQAQTAATRSASLALLT